MITLDESGQYEKAFQYLQQSHSIYLDAYGESHEEIAELYRNIVNVQLSAHNGTYDDSL